MIEVSRSSGEITVNGHAGFAPEGQDIICASVSALVQTLVYSLEDLTEDKIEYELSPGTVYIKYRNLSERAQLLIDSFFVGIETISSNYPYHVRIVQA